MKGMSTKKTKHTKSEAPKYSPPKIAISSYARLEELAEMFEQQKARIVRLLDEEKNGLVDPSDVTAAITTQLDILSRLEMFKPSV